MRADPSHRCSRDSDAGTNQPNIAPLLEPLHGTHICSDPVRMVAMQSDVVQASDDTGFCQEVSCIRMTFRHRVARKICKCVVGNMEQHNPRDCDTSKHRQTKSMHAGAHFWSSFTTATAWEMSCSVPLCVKSSTTHFIRETILRGGGVHLHEHRKHRCTWHDLSNAVAISLTSYLCIRASTL